MYVHHWALFWIVGRLMLWSTKCLARVMDKCTAQTRVDCITSDSRLSCHTVVHTITKQEQCDCDRLYRGKAPCNIQ
jgi:hypothetical protein